MSTLNRSYTYLGFSLLSNISGLVLSLSFGKCRTAFTFPIAGESLSIILHSSLRFTTTLVDRTLATVKAAFI